MAPHIRSGRLSLLFCLMVNAAAALPIITGTSGVRELAVPGQSFALQVNAAGSGTLSYAWSHNGRPIIGATGDTLAVAAARCQDSGWYIANVSDDTGSTRSPAIFVSVTPVITRPRPWSYSSIWEAKYGQDAVPADVTDFVAIAASTYHSVALRRDGKVVAWGGDFYSQGSLQVPADLTDVVAIAAGMRYSLALKSDGTLAEWGTGQVHAPAGLAEIVSVAASPLHALALRSDGTVVAWGNQSGGRCAVPAGLSGVVGIACNYYHSLALKRDGTVVGWGDDYFGEIDPPSGLSDAIAIAAGRGHSLALKSNGTVVAWGDNTDGQCNVPAGLAGVVAVAAARAHSLALKSDGTVVGWGAGQTNLPPGVNAVFAISAAGLFSFALSDATTDAAPVITNPPIGQTRAETQQVTFSVTATGPQPLAYQWRKSGTDIGGATSSVLTISNLALADAGDYDVVVTNYLGSTTSPAAHLTMNPAPVVSVVGRTRQLLRPGQPLELKVGASGTGALSYQWLHNGHPVEGATAATYARGRVGFRDTGWYFALITDDYGSRRSAPTFVTVAPQWVQVVAWPLGDHGPTKVPADLIDATMLAVGGTHALAGRANGTVVQWGDDSYGVRPPPARVADIVAVAAGTMGAAALKSDGTVIAWDSNLDETLVPTSVTNVVAIAQGYRNSLALRSDGVVVEWGDVPVGVPAQLTNVVGIAAGSDHALTLRADGIVSGWGRNDKGQTTVPSGLSNVTAVAAGGGLSLALKADGTVVAWGDNTYGQLNVPAGLDGVVAISAGIRHALALKGDGTVVAWGSGDSGPVTVPAGLRNVFAIATGYSCSLALRDAESDLLAITGQPVGQTSSESQSAEFAVIVAGGGTLSYQWRRDGVAIPGAKSAKLVLTDLSMPDAGDYSVVVTNYLGSVTSEIAHLTVNPSPVVTQLSPRRRVLAAGERLELAVEAAGTGPLSYQWTRNGRAIPGATSQALSRVIQSVLDGGYYHVYVTDGFGTRRSVPIFVIVTSAPSVTKVRPLQPAYPGTFWTPLNESLNDVVAFNAGSTFILALRNHGTVAGWGSSVFGEVYPPAGLSDIVAVSAGDRVSVVLKRNGTVFAWGDGFYGQTSIPGGLNDVVAISAAFNYVLALKSDATVVAWGTNWDGECDVPAGLSDVVAVVAAGSSPVALKADGTVVTWGRPPASDSTAMPSNLNQVVAVDGNGSATVALRRDGTVAAWGAGYLGLNTIPAEVANVAAISVGGDAALALKNDGAVVGWGRDDQGIAVPADLTNVVAISAGGAISAALQASPVITVPPAGQTVRTGESATFSVTLFGAGPFTYQWRKDGVPLAGATSSTVTAAAASPSDAGSYDVVITNALGSTISQPVTLVVQVVAPVVTTQPASRAIGVGLGVTFTVEASGSGPSSYQWMKDGADLNNGGRVTGVSTSMLSIADAVPADAGGYSVVVTNGGGGVVSHTAVLAVLEARAAHGVMSGGYAIGNAVTIANTISYTGTLAHLQWSVLPPDGWTYASGSITGEGRPVPGASGLFEWTWTTVPPSPVTFSYSMTVPAGTTGAKTLTALVLARQSGGDYEVLVRPDPLAIDQIAHHTADTNRDFKVSLPELLRVVELYNAHHSDVRTGAYAVDLLNFEDGFAVDVVRLGGEVVALARYHSADANRDGRISLSELLRVIELYNHRSGTVRTGEYHVQEGTDDGFGSGP